MQDKSSKNIEKKPCLYLFPVPLSAGDVRAVLPEINIQIVSEIKYFVVENIRSARRFLKKCNSDIDIDSLTFFELNRHTAAEEIAGFLEPMAAGNSMGVISEAGCPAVADPGADVVGIAQNRGYKVVPLVGPSSILMSLMGSGFNGQSFAFLGYLPVDNEARLKKWKIIEQNIVRFDQTQIFIETPYRNNKIIAEMTKVLSASIKLCIASDITGENESIITHSIAEWRKRQYDYDKVPTIFLLYK